MARRERRFLCYPRPGLLEGMARIMDLGNTLNRYRRFPTAREADTFALRSDWVMVGEDVRHAIEEFKETEKDELTYVS